jgi:hypothetical protein
MPTPDASSDVRLNDIAIHYELQGCELIKNKSTTLILKKPPFEPKPD